LGEGRGINNGDNIMLNKTGPITGLIACPAKPVLDWSQRAQPASKLDQGGPQDGRDMDAGPPFRSEHQKTAEH